MNNLAFNRENAEVDLLIYALDRWEKLALEINNSANSIRDSPIDLIQFKQELLAVRQQAHCDYDLKTSNCQNKINSLIAELERLKVTSSQLNNIIALQERLEVLQAIQSVTSSPNYHYEFSIADDSAIKTKKQYSLREKILIFKLKYPENFWTGIIAIFLILLFAWRATAAITDNLSLGDRSESPTQLHQQ